MASPANHVPDEQGKEMQVIGRRAFLQRSAILAPAMVVASACEREAGSTGTQVAVDSQSPGGAAGPAYRADVKEYGAAGDGETDDTEAIARARDAVLSESINDGQLTRELFFPPGVYRVTRADALLNGTGGSQVRGYSIRGMGKRTSEIVFDTPASPTDDRLANNLLTAGNRVRALRVSSLSFRSLNPAQSWLYCWSRDDRDKDLERPEFGTGNNQDFVLTDVEWRGPWLRGIGLDGDQQSNMNSEWAFYHCHISNSGSFDDAFLHSGMSPQHEQQDQFLNFWFHNCKFEYSHGTLLRFRKGGFANVSGGSWIAGIGSEEPSTMFVLGAGPHFRAVQNLVVVGTRFELRHPEARLLDCGWAGPSAHITFQNTSDAAHAFKDWAPKANPVILRAQEGSIATVKFSNCELMGYHEVSGPASSRGRVIYEACDFANHPGGVGGDRFLRLESPARYRFVDCYDTEDMAG